MASVLIAAAMVPLAGCGSRGSVSNCAAPSLLIVHGDSRDPVRQSCAGTFGGTDLMTLHVRARSTSTVDGGGPGPHFSSDDTAVLTVSGRQLRFGAAGTVTLAATGVLCNTEAASAPCPLLKFVVDP